MKNLLTVLAAVFCVACLAVVSCSELDGNPHDEKSSNYAGGNGDDNGNGDGDSASTPAVRQFTVFFHANGGTPTTIPSAVVDSGTALGAKYPTDPARAGYTFGGWFDNEALYTASTVIAKDMMLTAKWDDDGSGSEDSTSTPAVRQFTVFFHANGGTPSTITPAVVDSGTTLGEKYPTEPARAGHTFGGWFDDAAPYTASTVIVKDVMLTAKWDIIPVKQFTVAFNTDGGTPATIEPVTVDSGTTLGSQFPAAPTKAGHTFGGWLDGVELYSASTVIIKGVTLVAMWNEDDNGGGNDTLYYTLTVGAGAAGGGTVSRAPDQAAYAAGTAVTVKATPMDGYKFMGWVGASTSTNDEITVTMSGNMTLTANFELIRYTLTTTVNPPGSGTMSRDPEQTGYLPATSVTVTVTPADGYTFTGWSGASTSTAVSVTVIVNNDTTLIANFEPIMYTLTTNIAPLDGGTVSHGPDRERYAHGTTVTITAMAAEGYEFRYWRDNEETEAVRTVTMNSNITLVADFQRTYRLLTVVSIDGAGTLSRDPEKTYYSRDDDVTLTATPAPGYTFISWSWGRMSRSDNPLTIKVTQDEMEVTANFIRGFIDERNNWLYNTTTINGVTWMAQNLNFATDNSWCYEDHPGNCELYGRLYNWDAAMDACPEGWRLPTRQEWRDLIAFVGSDPGPKLKAKTGWIDWRGNPDDSGTDDFGFTALPGGSRDPDGEYDELGFAGLWWGDAVDDENHAYYNYISHGTAQGEFHIDKGHGFSVRCVR